MTALALIVGLIYFNDRCTDDVLPAHARLNATLVCLTLGLLLVVDVMGVHF